MPQSDAAATAAVVDAVAPVAPIFAELPGDCNLLCFADWPFCATGFHKTEDTAFPGSGRDGVYHSECYSGNNCDQEHPYCSGDDNLDDEAFVELQVGIRSNDQSTVRTLLREFPQSLHLSSGRVAIQVTNCRQDVVANLPISPAMLRALGDFRAG